MTLNGCETGDAKSNQGLPPAGKVCDTDVRSGLASAPLGLEVADRLGIKSIAFQPQYGHLGFPKELAAQIAVAEVASFGGQPESIFMVCFDEDTLAI